MLTLEFVGGVVQVQVPVASSTLQKDPLPCLRVATTTHNVFKKKETQTRRLAAQKKKK
jgi:hypothetical protein